MAKGQYKDHTLTVRAGYYDYQRWPKPVPWIYLKGFWLRQAGFDIGTALHIKVSDGRLEITAKNECDP